jgi:hypothetical protein
MHGEVINQTRVPPDDKTKIRQTNGTYTNCADHQHSPNVPVLQVPLGHLRASRFNWQMLGFGVHRRCVRRVAFTFATGSNFGNSPTPTMNALQLARGGRNASVCQGASADIGVYYGWEQLHRARWKWEEEERRVAQPPGRISPKTQRVSAAFGESAALSHIKDGSEPFIIACAAVLNLPREPLLVYPPVNGPVLKSGSPKKGPDRYLLLIDALTSRHEKGSRKLAMLHSPSLICSWC